LLVIKWSSWLSSTDRDGCHQQIELVVIIRSSWLSSSGRVGHQHHQHRVPHCTATAHRQCRPCSFRAAFRARQRASRRSLVHFAARSPPPLERAIHHHHHFRHSLAMTMSLLLLLPSPQTRVTTPLARCGRDDVVAVAAAAGAGAGWTSTMTMTTRLLLLAHCRRQWLMLQEAAGSWTWHRRRRWRERERDADTKKPEQSNCPTTCPFISRRRVRACLRE
jgi:hypothetical protein